MSPRAETQNVLNAVQGLQISRPEGFEKRRTAVRRLEEIRESLPSVSELEVQYLSNACRILTHPALLTLARRGEITVGLIKPHADEARIAELSNKNTQPVRDDKAADIIRREIERIRIEPDGSRTKGEILLDINMQFAPEQVEEFYPGMKDREGEDWPKVWQRIVRHMSGGPATFLLIRHLVKDKNGEWIPKEDAVNWWRKRIGATNPAHAANGTIRRRFAREIGNNIVHGSDSKESAGREAAAIGEILCQYLPSQIRDGVGRRSEFFAKPDFILPPDRSPELENFCRQTAEMIGASELKESVGRVIDLSRERGILVHGVKDYRKLSLIEENGVSPLTPEGNASFWAAGYAIFGEALGPRKPLTGFDTPFFNYGFSKDKETSERHMILALTRVPQLSGEIHGRAEKDGVILIKTLVPRSEITLLHVVDRNTGKPERQNPLKTIQIEMLKLLEEVMSSETPNNKTLVRYI